MFWKLEHVFRSLRPVRRLPQPPRWRTRLALEALEARRLLSTYTVTTTADGVPGSLREAIYQVDHTPDVDTIEFRLGAGDHTIHLGSPLDPITHYVYIHGTTAADGFVELEGSGAGAGANGLVFQVGTPDMSEVDGLAIVRFGQDGILIRSGGPVEVSGCFIGTDPMGAVGLGNGGDGVAIVNSSTNVIGLTGAGPGNIISGNRQNGVHLSGNTTAGNVIQGNIIGLNPQGTASLGNSGSGVLIELNAAGNRVGGTDPGYRNVISANGQNGITIFDHSSTDNLVQGNYIGTDANGAIALGNIHDGIRVDGGARSNTIGGQEDGARNVISGNGEDGAAILGTGTSGNLLAGNYVGIDASGTYAISNASRCSGECLGVRVGIINASGNMVDGNVISGNIKGGLSLDNGAFNNVVTNNLIGTTPDGNSALGNSQKGIIIQSGAHNNSVRGNLISGNMGAGLNLFANETRNNIIQGNLIGTDLTGTLPLPNTNEGIFMAHPTEAYTGS